ncbi:MAG: hypothetical protein QXF12_01310 [Candidatus Aenigmatarchaeota archaeon]
MMYQEPPILTIAFLYAESVPLYKDYYELPLYLNDYYNKKVHSEEDNAYSPYTYVRYCRHDSLLSKTAAIMVGSIDLGEGGYRWTEKLFFDNDEKNILESFAKYLGEYRYICSYYTKNKQVPFIIKRMIMNRLDLPVILSNMQNEYLMHGYYKNVIDIFGLWNMGLGDEIIDLDDLSGVFDKYNPQKKYSYSDFVNAWYKLQKGTDQDNYKVIEQYMSNIVKVIGKTYISLVAKGWQKDTYLATFYQK